MSTQHDETLKVTWFYFKFIIITSYRVYPVFDNPVAPRDSGFARAFLQCWIHRLVVNHCIVFQVTSKGLDR